MEKNTSQVSPLYKTPIQFPPRYNSPKQAHSPENQPGNTNSSPVFFKGIESTHNASLRNPSTGYFYLKKKHFRKHPFYHMATCLDLRI